MNISLSKSAQVKIEQIGNEKQKIVIVDLAFDQPNSLIDDACHKSFSQIGPYYPGIRAEVDKELLISLYRAVAPYLDKVFGLAGVALKGECFYSMVTKAPAELLPIQRLPHSDGIEGERIAVLAYLARPEQGGTNFYRHRSSGFESVGTERFAGYTKTLEQEVRQIGFPEAGYVGDGGPLFKRIANVSGVFNRLIIYRGFLLHCSAIDNQRVLSADPCVGRLTLNAVVYP